MKTKQTFSHTLISVLNHNLFSFPINFNPKLSYKIVKILLITYYVIFKFNKSNIIYHRKSAKSTESLYSSSSSKYSASALYRRRSQNPVPRCNGFMNGANNNNNEVRQRVLSARRLRMKTLQNQLADCQQHISELAHENRILRTVHKRQDQALKKYESTNAELPTLLHSHAEEIRIWQSKYKTLQHQNKELTFKMKQRDAQILAFSDQNKYLSQLNKDKNLEDRQKLTDQVQKMEIKLQEKDNEMKLLARKLQLETKSFKIQVQLEHKRYKDAMAKLEKAKNELAVFNKLDELEVSELFELILELWHGIGSVVCGFRNRSGQIDFRRVCFYVAVSCYTFVALAGFVVYLKWKKKVM